MILIIVRVGFTMIFSHVPRVAERAEAGLGSTAGVTGLQPDVRVPQLPDLLLGEVPRVLLGHLGPELRSRPLGVLLSLNFEQIIIMSSFNIAESFETNGNEIRQNRNQLKQSKQKLTKSFKNEIDGITQT